MSVHDDCAFPIDSETPYHWGMSYREFLASQIAGGLAATPAYAGTPEEQFAVEVVDRTDALIRLLHERPYQ